MFFINKKIVRFDKECWHVWFAWYPITIDTKHSTIVIWLQSIERRWIPPCIYLLASQKGYWEYRLSVNKNLALEGC
jgi:hypothetical protein